MACIDVDTAEFAVLFCPHVSSGLGCGRRKRDIINSADGLTWSNATSPTSETLRGVYFDDASTWVAAGQKGTIVNSPDAVVWTQQTSGNTNALWGTVFAGGQWIVSGGSGRIVTSPDSVVWTSVNGPFSFTLFDIAYDGSGLYVIAGDGNNLSTVLISNDAVTWTQTSLPEQW